MATINGTFNSFVGGTISGSVGVPGPAGATGPAGPTGATGAPGAPGVGVPVGGTSGQFLQKTSGADYATDWVTVNPFITSVSSPLSVNSGVLSIDLSAYLTTASAASIYQTLAGMSDYLAKAGNLAGLANTGTARTNLGLGSLAVINDAPSDGSQYARKNGAWDIVSAGAAFISSVSSPLSVTTGNLTVDLSAYAQLSGATFTGNVFAPTPSPGTDSTRIATTEWVKDFDYAPTNSPHFTGNPQSVTPSTGDNDTSIATTAFVKAQGYITSSALSPYLISSTAASTYQTLSGMSAYLTTASAATSYYPLSGNPSGFLTSAPVTSVAGRTGAITLSNTDISGLGGLATVNDAPSDGSTYGRENGAWVVAGGGSTFTGGPITSPITYDDGGGFLSTFSAGSIGINLGGGTAPYYNANFNQNRFYLYSEVVGSYGTETATAQFTTTGFSSVTTGPFSSNLSVSGSGVIYSENNYGAISSFSLTPNGVQFMNPAGGGSSPAFGYGGLTFSDGTTQTTAASGGGMSPPSSSNAVWYSGGWYSANVTTVYDTSYNYVNVLTF
jgi:hypothetical protein